jgi:hypothetical protein
MSEFLHAGDANPVSPRPYIEVAVVMRRERIDNRWQSWRWALADVVIQEPIYGTVARLLLKSADEERWLHPGFRVELLVTDAEGYYLNATTTKPCFWVVWRMEEEPLLADEVMAVPTVVTLSYHDAGRWLDAQENVEQVPAPSSVVQWLQAFVEMHHVPEVKRRQRPESFKSLQDRFGSPARVSIEKKFKGPEHD